MHSPFRSVAAALLCGSLPSILIPAYGEGNDARALVRAIVQNEVTMDAHDHSHWMFRDSNKVKGKINVTLVVQTPEGNVSKTIEIDGQPLTPEQQKDDERKMQQFVTDPAVQQKQKHDQEQDSEKAASLTKLLPNAFLWTKAGESDAEATLLFKPDPQFHPPTREARVFAAMQGTMVVNTKQKRIKSLRGTLVRDVDFGSGLLGKLEKGGTFDVERQQIGPHVWEITATHIHIHGHALIFKSISEEQDEETSDYKPVPQSITLAQAVNMLNGAAHTSSGARATQPGDAR